MAEYSRIAKGHFTSTGNAQIINLPFQPDRVEMINLSLVNAGAAASKILTAYWDVSMGQGLGLVQGYSSGSALIYDNIPSNGISTFAAGQLLQYGPLQLLGTTGGAGIALTSSSVLTVTTAAANTIVPGDWVIFQNLYETSTTGMQQIAGIPFQVQSANWSTTSFQVAWNGTGTGLTAIDTSATGAAGFKKILYPTLYEPGIAFPYSISVTAGVGTVICTAPHNFVVGQEIAFRIPTVYGAQNLNELPDASIPGSPQYYYVTTVANETTFTFANAPVLSSAFNLNQAFLSFPGLKFAQVLAVGDINSGGWPYTGGALYPSPQVSTNLVAANTINGPAIQGAYINNTSQGFIIGSGAGRVITSGVLVGANTNIIYWSAYLSDLAVN
jgi:hypothetical protein